MTTLHGPPLDQLDYIGALTLGGFIDDVAARFSCNEALVFDDARWTYGDLWTEVRRVAAALIHSGVEPGERVAILMGNRPEAVASIFGAAMAGAVAVPLSTFSTSRELADLLRRSEAVAALTQDLLLNRHLADEVAELRADLPHLRVVAAVGSDTWDRFLGDSSAHDAAVDARAAAVRPVDDGLIIFSSGTTSTPKGMVHNHRAPTLQFWLQAHLFGRHEGTRMWTSLPLFWTAGLNTAMGSTLAVGGCWVMQETFEPGAALALMASERVTEPYCLPHQTAALAEHPDWESTDVSAMTCVYGKSAFARHPRVTGDPSWNMPVGYGLSETCAFVVAHGHDRPQRLPHQSMGWVLPGSHLRVVDPETGRVLGPDEEGELAVAGPTLMERYLGSAPADCFDADGFFHTGDAGHHTGDGSVRFTGRRTEMIKTAGANVSPAELEVELRAFPPVKLARIVGLPDPRLDQIVVACITVTDGNTATEADIQAFLRDRVASYKVPKRVLFFADGEIPMTGSHTKVRDEELVALAAARLAAEPEPQPTPTSGAR